MRVSTGVVWASTLVLAVLLLSGGDEELPTTDFITEVDVDWIGLAGVLFSVVAGQVFVSANGTNRDSTAVTVNGSDSDWMGTAVALFSVITDVVFVSDRGD